MNDVVVQPFAVYIEEIILIIDGNGILAAINEHDFDVLCFLVYLERRFE